MHFFRSRISDVKLFAFVMLSFFIIPDFLKASESHSYSQMKKKFNQKNYQPDGLRIISQRRSCIPSGLSYHNKQLSITCQFSENRTDELVFESKYLSPELGRDHFSVKLNENTLVTFFHLEEAHDFYQDLVMIICKEEEAKYAPGSESSFLKFRDVIRQLAQTSPHRNDKPEPLVTEAEIDVKTLIFDFHRNHNIYFDSRFYPKYLKDENPSILEFAERFLTISQKSFAHMMRFSLRNVADMLKIISVNCFCEPDLLKEFEQFFKTDNASLTAWFSKQNIFLSDNLSKIAEGDFHKDDLVSLLKDENDFMFLLILRSNLGGVRPTQNDTIFTSEFQQSRLRVFLLLQLFRSSQPDYQEFFEEITNESNGPKLQDYDLDFDYYGRFAQAGSSVSEYLKMESKLRQDQNSLIPGVYNAKVTELLNHWLESSDFFSYLNDLESDDSQINFISTLLDLEAGTSRILEETPERSN